MYKLIEKLYPICRSITGNEVRKTFNIIKEFIDINIKEIPSETKVFDWKIPPEWNINDAYVKNSKGEKIIDFKKHNLHIVSYSEPVNLKLTYNEFIKNIYTLPKHPDWIPYRTSYYKKTWGFCMKHNDFLKLDKNDIYHIFIDSTFKKGNLTYADLIIPGKVKKEILFSCYICHPSMCNDSISGVVVSIFLAKYLLKRNNYYTYRFVFIPETIGSIAYLSLHMKELKENVIGGYVITCVGDEGNFTYLKTRKDNQLVDKITPKTCYSLFYKKGVAPCFMGCTTKCSLNFQILERINLLEQQKSNNKITNAMAPPLLMNKLLTNAAHYITPRHYVNSAPIPPPSAYV